MKKDIGNYILYSTGQIFSKRRNKFMSLCANNYGYLTTVLDGKSIKVHVLIAKYFLDNPNGLREINHIDGDKGNNHISNLEWCSRSKNVSHAWKIGLNRGRSGLTDKQVICVRFLKHKCNYSNKVLSKLYNVDRSSINRIVNGVTYRNV